MTFTECIMECAKNAELVKEFDRISGCNLSLLGAPVELMIDKATGKLEADVRMFIRFVYDCVWSRLHLVMTDQRSLDIARQGAKSAQEYGAFDSDVTPRVTPQAQGEASDDEA